VKVLVTGGAGYLGTSLVPLLLDRGAFVTVFDSLAYGGDPLLPFFRNPRFQFVFGDVRDARAVEEACAGMDVIVHLAAIVGFPACRKDPELAAAVNVDGTRNIARALSAGQLVLFGSTGSNYGALVDAVCTEETPLNPISVYGKTKTAAERLLMDTGRCVAYRFATAFGVSPRMRLDLLINDLTYQAVTQQYAVVYESDFMRTFIHVLDIARSFLFAIDHAEEMRGQVYNVGSERMNLSKRQVCEAIAERTRAYFHYADVGEDLDKRNYIVSYRKIRALGFELEVGLEEGLKELIKALSAIRIRNPYANA
jgi:nucleoside-diphosphate-sugar epimerase